MVIFHSLFCYVLLLLVGSVVGGGFTELEGIDLNGLKGPYATYEQTKAPHTHDFISGIEYTGTAANPTLDVIHHEEGRIQFSGTSQEWQFLCFSNKA